MRRLYALMIRLLLALAVALLLFDAVIVGLRYQSYAIILLAGLSWRMYQRRGRQASGNFGTARASGFRDLKNGGLLAGRGLVLGRIRVPLPSKWQVARALFFPGLPSEWAVKQFFAAFLGLRRAGEFIRTNNYVHLATFAPAGGGKSVAVLVPNLLSYAGNCVVIDPKGELYKLTHKHREREFGHRIVRLDPAQLYGRGDCFNPLDWINPNRADFIEACRGLANMLVVRTGKELDPHWCDSAENVIAAFIAFICALEGNPEARTLREMRTHLASRANYERALEIMQGHAGFYGALQQLSHSLTWHVDKELGSVMTHAQRFTNIFDSPLLADTTGSTSFDPMQLRHGRMTIYLIVPGDRLVVWAGLQRLWLGALLRLVTQGKPTERNPVLFMVDECAHIGKMDALEEAITLLRGSGIRMWLFFQSIEQLRKCFGENAGTVLDNLATQQYFSITSYETAEIISKRIGDATIVVASEGDNSGSSSPIGGDGKSPGSHNRGRSVTWSEKERRVLKPEEILVLPEDTAVVFHRNNYVIICDKIKYYADQAFQLRGFLPRRWGTGRAKGLGLGSLLLALVVLALALAVTRLIDGLPLAEPDAYGAAVSDGVRSFPASVAGLRGGVHDLERG